MRYAGITQTYTQEYYSATKKERNLVICTYGWALRVLCKVRCQAKKDSTV